MTGTIAAGEIVERSFGGLNEVGIYPFGEHQSPVRAGQYSQLQRDPDTGDLTEIIKTGVSFPAYGRLTPAEARDFARAILAAADWAERQGG